MLYPLTISQRSFDYLLTQNGDLPRCDGLDPWIAQYQGKLRILLEQIENVHAFPKHVLDVGSGLGGIDALLIKRTSCRVALLDGEAAGPEVIKYDVPFCARSVVDAFMADNHIDPASYTYHTPQDLPPGPFDLVISFASWCFHYPPDIYLPHVLDTLEPRGKMIIDVRRDRPEWHRTLNDAFPRRRVILCGKKYDRIVYRRD